MKTLVAIVAAIALPVAPLQANAQSRQTGQPPAQHEHAAHDHGAQQQAAMPEPQPKTKRPDTGPHGGTIQQVGQLQVETLVEASGLRLFATNHEGQPLELSQARGLATLQIEGNAKRYRYDLFPEVDQDQRAKSLAVAVDLSQMAGRKADIAFLLMGLQRGQRGPLQFTVSSTVPMTAAQQVAAAIAEQKVCPVSGHSLGSMGKPIPVTISDQTVYVCCKGCIDAVKENPAKYLPQQQVKLTVTKVTAADTKAIARQQVCPVMDVRLDAMGGPYKTVVEGRIVYLCCPGCTKKLHANPGVYLEKLANQGVTPPVVK